ncbi:MAG: type I methionyl aminopeptidase [Candidatus Liptonbacteria bacterium]|nr:type I methionyl aminopeptidase [Candidatus Liptonbacteria bacterium]
MPKIAVRNSEEIEIMAEAGKRLAKVLSGLKEMVKIGLTTAELDFVAKRLIEEAGCTPAFLGYRPGGAEKPYPASICASVNDGVVHGLPSGYELKSGDILKLDLGLIYKSYYSDMAITIGVGKISKEQQNLISATREALDMAIAAAKPGNTLGDIGYAVQSHVRANGFSVVHDLTGHGIGKKLHEDPYVFNVGRPGEGERLEPGMVLALEPMVAMGKGRVRQLADDSFVTADGSMAAHFEHTVAITADGPRILTRL